MKILLYIFALIFIVSTAYAAGFGVTPGKLDFGLVQEGIIYEKNITVVNNDQDLKLNLFSNDKNIKFENENQDVKADEKKRTKAIIEIVDCKAGKNEGIIILSTDYNFNAGVGIKVSYIVKDCKLDNKITGLSIAGDKKNISYENYILYGFCGLVLLIIMIKFVNNVRKKRICSRI